MDDLILINKQILAEIQRMCALLEEQLAPIREHEAKKNKENVIMAILKIEMQEVSQQHANNKISHLVFQQKISHISTHRRQELELNLE